MLRTIFPSCKRLIPHKLELHHSYGYAAYSVESVNPMNSSHELAGVNPLIPKSTGGAFQHPAIRRDSCGITNCKHKLCDKLCGDKTESEYVGHGTHDGSYPGTVYTSSTDLNGKDRPQYAQMYEKPITKTSCTEKDTAKSEELNSNPEMKSNIHMNASRKSSELIIKDKNAGDN